MGRARRRTTAAGRRTGMTDSFQGGPLDRGRHGREARPLRRVWCPEQVKKSNAERWCIAHEENPMRDEEKNREETTETIEELGNRLAMVLFRYSKSLDQSGIAKAARIAASQV